MAGQSSAAEARTGDNLFLKAVAALSTLAGWLSAAMIVIAVGITCQMIFIRFVLNGSTVWQTEAVVYLMVGATLMGLPYVQRLRGHVNVDLIPLMMSRRLRRVMAIFTLCVSIAIIGVMLFYGYEYWHFAWERGWRSDTVWGPKLWIPYLAIPLGFGLLMLQLIADLVAVLLRIDTPFGLGEDA
ncbi:TRAP transporter - DctQ subunit [Dinoroseobacter shibae DFL 12 = DSM 16493]|jgi:TRAP-type C4-dicarboxylate transport system permease small subunit|uniref:TRAP transporter small permease protein n=1 Tax=Dinoroseobacter shibae (strain DSM 16493 / NCIMB 14021 / DFL 12) TaxID=398580 RepID=A8LKF2_DINSH|nr:TRAP transporter small permease [Dinoroseobacter shibae]ABV94735.1 TRAP transporter - DctQ subunit [Dinoroseobacter shibae DFL 12 = DSM 16493]URF46156.1 TRAP transporter small permease [Dinoroseobacter shibae]URF50463.1 TRAP transporter small permease [Dinoroseobacter shibae]